MIFKVMLMARMLALMKVYHENSLLLKNFEDLKTSVTLNHWCSKQILVNVEIFKLVSSGLVWSGLSKVSVNENFST